MNNDIKKTLKRFIKDIKQLDDFDVQEPLIESGLLDSLDIMNLIAQIDEHFKVSIDGEDLTPENFYDIAAISILIEKLST